jgi:ketosteroid isomerase-like protein
LEETAMSVQDVAQDFVYLYNAGQYDEIASKYWSDDVTSIENMEGPMARVEGKAAVQGKSDWWFGAHEVHSSTCAGPYVNGDQFAVRYSIDVTNRESGQRVQMDEVGVYTVRNGKIVEERFFY